MPIIVGAGTTIQVESPAGSGLYTDLTNYLLHDSVTVKVNSLDFAFWDPPANSAQLGAKVMFANPTWTGTIASAMNSDPVDLRNGHRVVTVTATNTNALVADTAPFDLSDVPTATPLFDYLLEDGSGHYLLEDGTDWAPGALMLEGSLSYGYAGLSVRTSTNPTAGGPPQTLGRANVFQPGLRPGNLFKLTSLNQGYSSASFEVTQITVTWPGLRDRPFYAVEFGDTPQTLAAWSLNQPIVVATTAAPIISPPAITPPTTTIYGRCTASTGLKPMGGGIVTVATATFTFSGSGSGSPTCQVQAAIDARMDAWDNYIATPRRAVRATLSGGLFTGAWQELPFGLTEVQLDLSSATGIAISVGTYTVTIDINTQEYNQMRIFNGWAQVLITA